MRSRAIERERKGGERQEGRRETGREEREEGRRERKGGERGREESRTCVIKAEAALQRSAWPERGSVMGLH